MRFLVRELTVPMEYRVGLHKRVQGFINMPVGWSNTQINVANQEDFRNDGGIGDLIFGLTIQCVEADGQLPVRHHDDLRHGADGRRSVYRRGRHFAHRAVAG